ncbi:MAG: alpha-L-rhamnosidase C-terminal domain-containing protein, partial [Pseudomonadales bacterium]
YPFEHQGAFECSDSVLTRLWEIGRYTTEQCTHDAREDCPGREKRQWLGDGLVHYLIGAAAFGTSARPIDLQFLRHGAESQRPDGLLQMFAPGDHHVDGIIIPDFNLHWIVTLYHYYLHYDDVDAVAELFPAVQKVLAWFERQSAGEALITDLPYWHFIEWADLERSGVSLPLNALLIGALRAAAVLAASIGYPRAQRAYNNRAQRAADALNESHWDPARGAYVDSTESTVGQISQQGNALMIHFDIAPRQRWAQIVQRITDSDRLKLTAVPPVVMSGERLDKEHDVVLANTFFSHYVFSALADAGRFDLAIEQMRTFYEPMLAAGATTLWESYHSGASLCHAFSATPVYQLSAHALGVRPGVSGFREIVIAPQPGDLEWARGVYPTMHGPVAVSWQCGDGILDLEVDIPAGTRGMLVTPPGYLPDQESAVLDPGTHVVRFRSGD